jgi:phosphinothricin tripeptide acetyl hydrolase
VTIDWRYRWLRAQLWWLARRRPPATLETTLAARDLFEDAGTLIGIPVGATVEPADADGVPVEWMRVADSAPDRNLMYIHGGAYVMGSVNASRNMLHILLQRTQATGFNVDYRLAPEHPFPAGLEDCVTAYAWLLSTGIDPQRIAVAGDSAGGGLVAGMLVAARDRGLPMPACAAITSAWADLALAGRSYEERARRDPALSVQSLQLSADLYLDGQDPSQPLASPVNADLHGLPPLLVMVGTDEVVFDDSIRIAERARAAGVPVDLVIGEGMIHCWTGYVGKIRQAEVDLEHLGQFVRDHIPSCAPV